ncbi:hypothetical protein [Trinickia diaoshuihuensis]|uniref:hypothetical protein n=1 Tax=Trinickia diaoshuihuensis TaxID=2292265 RepID=UPI0013C2D747|nr:hypothetical protein [Trinickia diaoshuihuensis]
MAQHASRLHKQGASDSYVYLIAKGREIAITKEVRGEGARDIAEALDSAAAHKVDQL